MTVILLLLAMSFRGLPTSKDGLVRLLRSFSDRLDLIESGNFWGGGKVSFGPVIQIGGVEISVTPAAGDNLNVTFRNIKTGATSVINL